MLIKPTINRIKPDIKNASVYLRSTKKWGKTTLFRDVILEKYGDPAKGLLIKCGHETGDTMLDAIQSVAIDNWKDLVELKDWLVAEKGKEHNIEIIAFDTVDELVQMADAQTIKEAKKADPTKQVKSIKAAFGGFGAGSKYSANQVIKPLMTELKKHFGIWAIAHTKLKTINEKGNLEEDGYQQLTSNLPSDYESAFGDIMDITVTGVIDHVKEYKEGKDFTGKSIQKGYLTETTRKLYFRGTPMIDAGGRFADAAVPEFMVFESGKNNAAEFLRIVEEGMEKSKLKLNSSPSVSVKETIIAKPEPEPEIEEIVEDPFFPEEEETTVSVSNPFKDVADGDVEAARVEIKKLYKACTDKEAKSAAGKIIKAEGSINDVNWDTLVKLYGILTD